MNQLQAALQKAGISREDLPLGKKDQKPKRAGKRSTGEITLRCLRVILLAEVSRFLNPGEMTEQQSNQIVSALLGMSEEVEERLGEYDAEREAQQKF